MNIESLVNPKKIRKSRVEYLVKSETSKEFQNNLQIILDELDSDVCNWVPVGQQVNNQMIADITDNMTGIVENLTNISDAYLLQNYNGGDYYSSHDAADKILSDETAKMRFDGYKNSRSRSSDTSITFSDTAHGQPKENFDVFVSPYSSGVQKQNYNFIHGRRGVGGMTALSHTKNGDKFVASASDDDPESWTWTVIQQKQDGDYYYLTVDGEFPSFKGSFDCGSKIGKKSVGTVVKLYSYQFRTNPINATGNAFVRRLSQYLPNPVVPIEIIDTRGNKVQQYEYNGIRNEISQVQKDFHHISDNISVTNIGDVNVNVYIKKKSENQHTNVITTQNEPRVLVSVNGQSHARYMKSRMKSEIGIDRVGENMIIYAEFTDNTLDANENIFNTGRDGFSDAGVEKQFMNAIYRFVSNNKAVERVNKRFAKVEEQNKSVDISGIDLKFGDCVTCKSRDSVYKNISIETEHEKLGERSEVSSSIETLAGELLSCKTEFIGDELRVTVKPDFTDLDRVVCKVNVCDEKSEYSTTFTLKEQESKERSSEESKTISEPDCDSPLVSLATTFSDVSLDCTESGGTAQTQGEKFEFMIENWIESCGESISSTGGKNHPPDYLLKEGPALECKSITGYGRIQTNSSPPEQNLEPDNPRIKDSTADTLRKSSDPKRNMFYAIGSKNQDEIQSTWICQGDILFGEHNLDEITEELQESAMEIAKEYEVETTEDTNEIAKLNGVDNLERINLRIRRMMSFDHPVKLFNYNVEYDLKSSAFVLATNESWFENLSSADKIAIEKNESLKTIELNEKSIVLVVTK